MTIRERAEHLAQAETSEAYRVILVERMRRDRVFFINLACWTFDPRLMPERRKIPFLLFPKQEEYVAWLGDHIDRGEDGLTEKSRDTGATWCVLACVVHGWLFEQGFTALVGSRVVDLVDVAGVPDTHFWKMLYLVENLPVWLKPEGWKADKPHRTYLKMANPSNGSVITGAPASPDFGRQGRYKVVFTDEFAAWEYASSAWTACAETTECRLAVSTPRGMNFFGQLANPKNIDDAMDKFRIHWKDDPRHGRTVINPKTGECEYPYLVKARRRYAYDPTMLAQEIEIDYNRSVQGRVYPQIDHVRTAVFRYRPALGNLYVSWDFGLDTTAMGWYQFDKYTGRYAMLDYYQNKGHVIDFYIPFVTGSVPSNKPWTYSEHEIEIIRRHRDWEITEHFGDPSGKAQNLVSLNSPIEYLSTAGIYVTTNSRARKFTTRIHAARVLLTRLDVNAVWCALWLDAMRNYHFPKRLPGHNSTNENDEPVHDEFSHGATMFEWLAVNDPHHDAPVLDDDEADEDYLQRLIEREEDENDPMLVSRGLAGY